MSRLFLAAAGAVLLLAGLPPRLPAQDLSPRAYLITPLRANAVTVGNVFNDGDLHFEGTVPITGATGRMNMPNVTLYHSLSVLGRSANATATLAYGVGHFKGTVIGAREWVDRSAVHDLQNPLQFVRLHVVARVTGVEQKIDRRSRCVPPVDRSNDAVAKLHGISFVRPPRRLDDNLGAGEAGRRLRIDRVRIGDMYKTRHQRQAVEALRKIFAFHQVFCQPNSEE